MLFFVYGGSRVPNVNEAHYVGKAKHFWDSGFCGEDFFFASRDAHTAFFFTVGSLTSFLSLPQVTWAGRLLGWGFLAVTWQRLSSQVLPRRGAALFSAAVWLALIELFQMSGEWIIGGIEAKVIAYGFVFWGLTAFLQSRFTWAWSLFGIGAAFHVLVGGWAVVTAAFALLITQKPGEPWHLSKHGVGCLIGGLASLLGLLPALALNQGVDAATVMAAQEIYVYERLAHHLLISEFPSHFVVRHCLLIGGFLWFWNRLRRHSRDYDRLAAFAAGAIALVVVGAALDLMLGRSERGASLLRYYWFRESDVFVPMAVAIGLAMWLHLTQPRRPAVAKLVFSLSIFLLATHLAVAVTYWQRSWIPQADRQGGLRSLVYYHEWRDVCDWARTSTAPDSVFLTPPEHQTFKWYAHRAEVVNWKDVPQDAGNLLEWSRRLEAVKEWQDSASPALGMQRFHRLQEQYGFEYLITRWPTASPLPQSLQPIYRNRRYAVFRVSDARSDMVPTSRTGHGFPRFDPDQHLARGTQR